MNTRTMLIASSLIAASLVSGTAQAALQGRDLNGSIGSFEAYYDTDLNITWLAAANNTAMTWAAANTWAANLSFTDGVNTYDNWRLPIVIDTGTSGCDFAYTSTDCGYNVNTATSEMAHLFYDELGNKAYFTTAGASPQAGWGLTNTGPFTNLQLQPGIYWSGSVYAPDISRAWYVDFSIGRQYHNPTYAGYYALAVSPGDVAAVPEADTWAMLLAGLGLVGWRTQRRIALQSMNSI